MRILITITTILLSTVMSAQCLPDRHNTTWFDAWVSCETSQGPVSAHGEAHWIQYDLGYQYLLGELEIWNINDPLHLDRGAQTIHIDISEDGEEWTSLPDQTLMQGTGLSNYEGASVLDFEGAQARYVVITIVDTYGAICGGVAELRIEVLGFVSEVAEFETPNACFEVLVYPNPHRGQFTTQIQSQCGGDMDVMLHDAMGRLVMTRQLGQISERETLTFDEAALPAGIYYLTVQQDDALGRYQIVRTD